MVDSSTTSTSELSTDKLLTEHELWDAFLTHGWELSHANGLVVERFRPIDLLHHCGEHGHTFGLAAYLTKRLSEADDKEEVLHGAISDLENYLDYVKRSSEMFSQVKNVLMVEGSGNVPRYRAPSEAFTSTAKVS